MATTQERPPESEQKRAADREGGGPGDSQSLSCVVVEDQAMFLELLSGMIGIRGGIRVVAQARSVAEGKAACLEFCPDMLVLDLTLVDGKGLDVARTFLTANPAGRVIVVSGNASDFVCPSWLNKALQAVISKNETFQALRQELDELLGPVRPITASGPRDASHGLPMTPREAEVFALIGDGLTSREIGERLSISEHTVQTHRKRVAAKLGTQGDELTRIAVAQRQAFFRSETN